jgi:hypothetical protein
VNLVQVLGFGVIRLEILVLKWPLRRNAPMMAEFSEVLLSQTDESRSIKLRVAANEIVSAGNKLMTATIQPGFNIVVPSLANYRARIPVFLLTRHIVSSLEQQNLFS